MRSKYKKSFLIINILLILSIIFLMSNIFIFKNTSYLFVSLTISILFLIIFVLYGFEPKKRRFTYETMFYVFVFSIVIVLITYVMGIFTGFSQNIYKLNMDNFIHNILPYLYIIVSGEILRYEIVRKGDGSHLSYVLITVIMVLIDATIFLNTYNLETYDGMVKYICAILLPSCFKNVLLLYLTKNGGAYPSIIYRLIMDLKLFIIPIIPNFGLYVDCIVNITIPVIIGFLIHLSLLQFKNKEQEPIRIKNTKVYKYALLVILLIITFGFTALESGKFKYTIVAIGSDSMNPTFYRGDVVIYKKIEDPSELKVDDVLVFSKDEKVVVHRVVEVAKVGNEYIYYTKGDNNNAPDGYPILFKDCIGIYKNKIKYIGILSVVLKDIFS